MSRFTLEDLQTIIVERASEVPEDSYTASLLAKGTEKCAKKFGEESVEAVIAAMKGDNSELVSETADVLYHLLVLLESRNVTLDKVMTELEHRTAQTGLQEKASRKSS